MGNRGYHFFSGSDVYMCHVYLLHKVAATTVLTQRATRQNNSWKMFMLCAAGEQREQ